MRPKPLSMLKHQKITVVANKYLLIEHSEDDGATYKYGALIPATSIAEIIPVYPINNPQETNELGFTRENSGSIRIRRVDGTETVIKLADVKSPAAWSNAGGDATDVADAMVALIVLYA